MRKILTPLMQSLTRILTPATPAIVAAAIGLALPGLMPLPATAQGLFAPAITVNGDVITRYELEQRTQFMRLLNAPGDVDEQAREALIDDRLKQQAVKAIDLKIAPEDIENGIAEFASRTDLSPDDFVKALGQGGVSRETLRDYIKISLAWREYVRSRFGARARPSDAEIDRALGQAGGGGGVQVLLSEVIIPVTPQTTGQVEALAKQIAAVTGYDAFSAAATQYSASDSRTQGGRLNWMAINRLPPGLQPVILGLRRGEITAPIALPNAVALFQMRGIRESGVAEPRYAAIEYAAYLIPGGRSDAARATAAAVANSVDTCDDLYGIAKDQPPEVLERKTRKPGEIPRDVALELAKLDDGEVSTTLTRANGQTLVFLMMCGRTTDQAQNASREEVANALVAQRMQTFAESHLAQLRADALIVEK